MTSLIGTDTTAADRTQQDAAWWRQAVVYQIYPRSFADSNGDGIGDLRGITGKVDYLRDLGVDAVWLSPFYPSALADGGYDVDDYRDVDPRIGTLEDFDEMRAALHDAGIRLVVDIVPNHTSNRHVWFQEALASPPGSRARERYIFRRAAASTASCRPATGPRPSAARRGSPSATASGTCTCSPRSSPTSTGPTTRSARSSSPR